MTYIYIYISIDIYIHMRTQFLSLMITFTQRGRHPMTLTLSVSKPLVAYFPYGPIEVTMMYMLMGVMVTMLHETKDGESLSNELEQRSNLNKDPTVAK